jgi:hypothetical protein
MSEVLTWPEQVLREVPDHMLERSTGRPDKDRQRVKHFRAFCKARGAYPTLLEIENERKRRELLQEEAS